jgi:hypothetical protein
MMCRTASGSLAGHGTDCRRKTPRHPPRRRMFLITILANLQTRSDSARIALRFLELSSKLLHVLPRRLPVGIAGVAMELERTSTQPVLKLLPSESNGLVMIVWACDFEFGCCGHSLPTSLREEMWFREPGQQSGDSSMGLCTFGA